MRRPWRRDAAWHTGDRGAMGYSVLSRSVLACGHLLQSLSYTRWKPLSSQKRGFRPLSQDEPDLPALAPWGKAENHPIEGAEGQCLWWGLSPPEPFDKQTRHKSVFFAGAGVRTQGPCFSLAPWAAECHESVASSHTMLGGAQSLF